VCREDSKKISAQGTRVKLSLSLWANMFIEFDFFSPELGMEHRAFHTKLSATELHLESLEFDFNAFKKQHCFSKY
jgi:hypothetical protein